MRVERLTMIGVLCLRAIHCVAFGGAVLERGASREPNPGITRGDAR
jgi:hypothetical protein